MTAHNFSVPYACAVGGKQVILGGVTTRLLPRMPCTYATEFFNENSRELHTCSGTPRCGHFLKGPGCPFILASEPSVNVGA
jgi:hypothetical protein